MSDQERLEASRDEWRAMARALSAEVAALEDELQALRGAS